MAKKAGKTKSEIRESEPPAELASADDRLASTSMGSEPSEEDIRMRAYQKFIERGGAHGNHVDDWIAAEQELKSRR